MKFDMNMKMTRNKNFRIGAITVLLFFALGILIGGYRVSLSMDGGLSSGSRFAGKSGSQLDSISVPKNVSMGEMVAQVREVFSEQGWETAYAFFVAIDKEYGATFSHEIGHVMGDLLYYEFGTEGAARCDDTSNYGCYHGIFSRAITEEGVGILEGAVEFCSADGQSMADIGGCLHGLGHGLLAFRGYEESHLVAALEDCERTGKSAAESCYNGVYMEYNGRIMRTVEEGSQIGPEVLRPIDLQNPYEPCFDLPSQFQSACVYELPNWWVTLPSVSTQDMITFCEQITSTFAKECAGGVGRILPFSNNYDLETIHAYCTSFSTEEKQMWCLQDVTKVYQGMKQYFASDVTMERICMPLENSSSYKECMSLNWQ